MIVYTLVFASLSGPAIDLQKMPILAKKKIIFSDEAHLDLGGYVKKQNCRSWGTENPHAYIENPTHSKRVTVWCGLVSDDADLAKESSFQMKLILILAM